MKKFFKIALLLGFLLLGSQLSALAKDISVYRVYNPISLEHLYTYDPTEVAALTNGDWEDEGVGWISPDNGKPVYRLYNPVLKNHLFTTDEHEVDVLTTQDIWVKDFNGKPLFYSGGTTPVYRLYNRDLQGQHLLTTDSNENNVLPNRGWSQEGTAFYALSTSTKPDTTPENNGNEDFKDNDGNGAPDVLEKQDKTTDSDGDSLPDYFELTETNTNSLKKDTNNDGYTDDVSDEDSDGLTNYEELELGSNPLTQDSDNDGLSDPDEAIHRTQVMNSDTDGDGAFDGWEVQNGYDPLNKDSSFKITDSSENEDLKLSVETQSTGNNANTLKIENCENDTLFNSEIPGYLGKAFEITSSEPINQATISIDFSQADKDSDNFVPTIYYINEENQTLEELPTTVSGNTAIATVTHFSKYALLNKATFDKIWDEEIRRPGEESNDGNGNVSIAFVLDYSYSMVGNDPDNLRNTLTKKFIDKLTNNDRGSVVSFIRNANVLTELTNDKNVLKQAVDSIVDDDGVSENSGTNGSAGIKAALDQLTYDTTGNAPYIIFMTDGEDTYSSYSYDELINSANQQGVHIFSIGLGDANANLLKKIATQTNGSYFYADDASGLEDAFDQAQQGTMDYHTDSNNDGISDYYTRLLCEGILKGTTGVPIFNGVPYDDIQQNNDFDKDGVINGDEVQVTVRNEKVGVNIISSPEVRDSDLDGIGDKRDTAPLTKGF